MIKYIYLTLFFLLLFSCKTVEKETFDLVLINGSTINIKTGNIEQKDIFITNGRIKKISASSNDSDYSSKQKIDVSGKYILPGFWDNHVHFRGGDSLINANKDFLKLFIMNGITTVRDAGGDLTSSVIKWNSKISKGNLIGPTIFTSGPKIDGPNPTWAGSLEIENAADISKALDSLEKLKTDFVKIYESKISREGYIETVKQATKRGLITSGHMPFTVELKENIDAGIGAIEHLYYVLKGCSSKEKEITQAIINKEYGFWESMGKLIATYDTITAQHTFQQLRDNNVYVVPTLHIGNTLSYLDVDNHEKDTYLKIIDSGIIKTYQGRINRALSSTDTARKKRKELNSLFKNLSKSLFDAEVKLLAGSDSGAFNSYTYPGISLHKELEAMVNAGISPLGALQTSAYNGSSFLKKNTDYGSISLEKIADFVILNTNPLDDIKNTRDIYRVVKNNQTFNPKNIAKEISCMDCIVQ